jgi:hypothetical protein
MKNIAKAIIELGIVLEGEVLQRTVLQWHSSPTPPFQFSSVEHPVFFCRPHDRTTTRFPSGSFPSNFMQLSVQLSFEAVVVTYGKVQVSRIPQSWHSIFASTTFFPSVKIDIKITAMIFHFDGIFDKTTISIKFINKSILLKFFSVLGEQLAFDL